jgi:hypothetical protein
MDYRQFARPHLAVFWAILVIGTVITWRFLPTTTSQIAYVLLFVFSTICILLKQGRIAGLSTMFLVLVSVNYWLLDESINSIIGSAVLILAAILIGRIIENTDENIEAPLTFWLILGLGLAQVNTIFSYWPISFFNRALLSGICFYTFWRLIELRDSANSFELVRHFLFVGITAMVVISSIIWANFPQLIPF